VPRFQVTIVNTVTGDEETITVEASRAFKSRTRAMMRSKISLKGCHVDYRVAKVEPDGTLVPLHFTKITEGYWDYV